MNSDHILEKIKRCIFRLQIVNNTPDRQQLKTLIISTNVGENLLETELLIAVFCQSGDNDNPKCCFWQFLICFG